MASRTSDRWYLYDGWNCVAEIDLQSSSRQVIKSYTWGLDLSGSLSGAGGVGGLLSIQHKWFSKPPHLAALDKPPHPQVTNVIPYLVFCDGNGNIVNLVDIDTGAISAHYEYDPFGRLVCKEGSYADDNEYRFSTKRYNAAWSLYDYGYWHYSPDLGRWKSRDPIWEVGGMNLYSTSQNNPLIMIDRDGLLPFIRATMTAYDRVDRIAYEAPESHIYNKAGEVVGQREYDCINCVGYALDEQASVTPTDAHSMADVLNVYGYERISDVTAYDCSGCCKKKGKNTFAMPRGFLWMS